MPLGINHNDARITTRWNEHDFKMAVFGVIHEAGHGMYEQDIDEKYADTPIYQGTSMGIHESQSLLMKSLLEATAISGKSSIHFSKNVQKAHLMMSPLTLFMIIEKNTI